jgi:hypothetical protein
MIQFSSTLLVSKNTPEDAAKGDLDLLKKINKSNALATDANADLQSQIDDILDRLQIIDTSPTSWARKYPDGTMEQWVQVAFSGNVTTPSGALFRSPNISLGNWPIPFDTLLGISRDISSDTGGEWIAENTASALSNINMGSIFIYGVASNAGVTATIYIYGFGTYT